MPSSCPSCNARRANLTEKWEAGQPASKRCEMRDWRERFYKIYARHEKERAERQLFFYARQCTVSGCRSRTYDPHMHSRAPLETARYVTLLGATVFRPACQSGIERDELAWERSELVKRTQQLPAHGRGPVIACFSPDGQIRPESCIFLECLKDVGHSDRIRPVEIFFATILLCLDNDTLA